MTGLLWRRAVFAALFALVTWLTLTPNPENTKTGFALTRWIADALFRDPALADKVAHFLAYAALGATAAFARLARGRAQAAVWLGLVAYGAGLEVVQGLGGVRTPELADGLANALGALAGYPATAALMDAIARRRAMRAAE